MAHAQRLGRMPTCGELKQAGDNALACAIVRNGGFAGWAARLSLSRKGTETHFGQRWEQHELRFFASLGFGVQRQTCRAPFDLLVNGARVDVKAARYTECANSNSGAITRGYVFAGLKRGRTCDFFDLLCIDKGAVRRRFIVPVSSARVTTLTITSSSLNGAGKYARFADAVLLLAEESP